MEFIRNVLSVVKTVQRVVEQSNEISYGCPSWDRDYHNNYKDMFLVSHIYVK